MYEITIKEACSGNWLQCMSPDTWILSIGTIIGAFLGAFFAGRYALASVKKQLDYQRDKELHDLDMQSIKFQEIFQVGYEVIERYCFMYASYFSDPKSIGEPHKKERIRFREIPDSLKKKLEDMKNKAYNLKMNRDYEILLIDYLHELDLIYEEMKIRSAKIENGDPQEPNWWTDEGHEEWARYVSVLANLKIEMSNKAEDLKNKHRKQSSTSTLEDTE